MCFLIKVGSAFKMNVVVCNWQYNYKYVVTSNKTVSNLILATNIGSEYTSICFIHSKV